MRPRDAIAIVLFGEGTAHLVARTRRALGWLGLEVEPPTRTAHLGRTLRDLRSPVWLLREGAVPRAGFAGLPKSATGLPVVAVGRTRALEGAIPSALVTPFPTGSPSRLEGPFAEGTFASLYVEDPRSLVEAAEGSLETLVSRAIDARRVRAFVHPHLDVALDTRLRVLELTTTLHRGGAERVVLSLHREIAALGATSLLATTSRPVRSTFADPEGTAHLHETGESVAELATRLAPDVVHAHLIDSPRLEALEQTGIPIAIHLHNARIGWPEGTDGRRPALVIACAHEVAKEAKAPFSGRVRTVWNGIAPSPSGAGARERIRRARRVELGTLVLLAIANVRPQKNLLELVSVLEDLVARGVDARLWLVGEPVARNEASLSEDARLSAKIASSPAKERILRVGPSEAPEDEVSAADVLVSASLHEGLSLVHLEALAEGLPVVARDVSGLEEVAARHPARVTCVPRDASVRAFADAVSRAPKRGAEDGLAPDFSARTMARTTLGLLEQVAGAEGRTRAGSSLLLVTNNLVVGGAQSSARRLLEALASRGFDVACATVEEQPEHPTLGSLSLEALGVKVFRAPSARIHDPFVSAREVARFCAREGVTHVLFWNVIAEVKTLLAERLVGTRLFDVSPGEMYFASLDRYFAKPRVGLAIDTARRYGALLEGAIVKYEAEARRAKDTLGAPVSVIRNGVPSATPAPRRGHSSTVVIGTAARISPDKKLEQIVDAFRACCTRHGNLELRIAGGPDRGCEDYGFGLAARAEGLPITFMGELSDVSSFLDGLDLFVAISEPSGCPNATLEAMAKGLAVVATDVGAAREQIVHGESGLVTPRGDVEGLAEGMNRFVSDVSLRATLGAAARERMALHFSMDRMADAYIRVLGLAAP